MLYERSNIDIVYDIRESRNGLIDRSCSPQSETMTSSSEACQKTEDTHI